MALIKVYAFVSDPDNIMKNMGIEPKEEDYIWTDFAFRTETVKEFYRKTKEKTMVTFYDEQNILIKEPFSDLFNRIKELEDTSVASSKEEIQDVQE